jgi:hypothetical protein
MITLKQARADGADRGRAAASWKFDGNTTTRTYEAFLAGYTDGDPMVIDAYAPPSWFSGEMAGESTKELLGIEGIDDGRWPETPERIDAAIGAYEQAADDAYWRALERVARFQVGPGWSTR